MPLRLFCSMFNVSPSPSLHSILKINPELSEPYFDVVGVVDPLTREAQKLSQLLIVRAHCCLGHCGDLKPI